MTRFRLVPSLPPALVLLVAGMACLLASAFAVYEATRVPWLGLNLVAESDGSVSVVEGAASALPLPLPATLVSIDDASSSVPVIAEDLLEEPDFLDEYADVEAFFRRQGALVSVLESPSVQVVLRQRDGSISRHRLTPTERPVRSLPAVFWFQLFVGVASALVGLWVLILRPREWSARMFALMSVTLACASMSAAVYSSRELALGENVFRSLAHLNHFGSLFFGAALIGLFLRHPIKLVAPKHLAWVFGIDVVWFASDALRLAPDMNWGMRLPMMLEMLVVIVLAGIQWRVSRGHPLARASLRWFGLSLLVGSSLFLITISAASMMGETPTIPQGYAFGFFLLMDVGFAVGLRKFKLLGIDEWAFRILLWVVGALVLVGIDVALIVVLRTNPAVSLSLALLLCGFLYLPARNWLWSKTTAGRRVDEADLFQGVLQVAFAVSEPERERLWGEFLESLFQPMELIRLPDAALEDVRAESQGLQLSLPSVASLPAVRLSYPWRGRGLFGTRDVRLCKTLIELMELAGGTRDAFQRGVLEERHRIARDLHDNVGARLLSGLYGEKLEDAQDAIRHSISDMRSVINELSGKHLSLIDILGELRHETASRIDSAGLELDWPLEEIPAADVVVNATFLRHFTAVLRELTSNAIRHSGADRLAVHAEIVGDALRLTVQDNGKGLAGSTPSNGLSNLRRRTDELGGTLTGCDAAPGVRWVLTWPLQLPQNSKVRVG